MSIVLVLGYLFVFLDVKNTLYNNRYLPIYYYHICSHGEILLSIIFIVRHPDSSKVFYIWDSVENLSLYFSNTLYFKVDFIYLAGRCKQKSLFFIFKLVLSFLSVLTSNSTLQTDAYYSLCRFGLFKFFKSPTQKGF